MKFEMKSTVKVEGHGTNNINSICREESIPKLIEWVGNYGCQICDSVKIVVGPHGGHKFVATKFLPADTDILHIPAGFDITLNTLRKDIDIFKQRHSSEWAELKQSLKSFKSSFKWSENNFNRFEIFSKSAEFAVCIIAILKTMKETEFEQLPLSIRNVEYYWLSLPLHMECVLYDWTKSDIDVLSGSSCHATFVDAKRFGKELFDQVIRPFMLAYKHAFESDSCLPDLETFVKVCSIIGARPLFDAVTSEYTTDSPLSEQASTKPTAFPPPALRPVIDLVNCTCNDRLANCSFRTYLIDPSQAAVGHVKLNLVSCCRDVCAGEELLIMSPHCKPALDNSGGPSASDAAPPPPSSVSYGSLGLGIGQQLMVYGSLPLDTDLIVNNVSTSVFLSMADFFELESLHLHKNAQHITREKKEFILSTTVMGAPAAGTASTAAVPKSRATKATTATSAFASSSSSVAQQRGDRLVCPVFVPPVLRISEGMLRDDPNVLRVVNNVFLLLLADDNVSRQFMKQCQQVIQAHSSSEGIVNLSCDIADNLCFKMSDRQHVFALFRGLVEANIGKPCISSLKSSVERVIAGIA